MSQDLFTKQENLIEALKQEIDIKNNWIQSQDEYIEFLENSCEQMQRLLIHLTTLLYREDQIENRKN